MKSIRCLFSLVLFSGLLLGAMALVACGSSNPLSDSGKSDTYIVVTSLVGDDGDFILSDVITKGGFRCNDNANVTIEAFLKGQSSGSSELNTVTVTSFRCVYSRSDGQNTPGVDVPFPVEGALNLTVIVDGTGAQAFVIVPHLAKLEPPLLGILDSGEKLITTAAVTFFGEDWTGNQVNATGYLSVHFLNIADEDEDVCP